MINQYAFRLANRLRLYFSFFLREKIQIGNYSLKLPPMHPLKLICAKHPNYDKFITKLSKILPKNSIALDIGANIGDTVFRLLSCQKSLIIHAFEPDPFYFKILSQNVKKKFSATQVFIYNSAISDSKKIFIKSSKGTASRSELISNQEVNALRVDDFSKTLTKNISLIKSDTDGWDWEIIKTSHNTILKHKPVLFFEMQINFKEDKLKYITELNWLVSIGYELYIFDNYGNFIYLINSTTSKLMDRMFQYIETPESNDSKITYFDICGAAKEIDKKNINFIL